MAIDIKKKIDEMSIEDLCGQVLCYDVQPNDTEKETMEVIKRIRPGSLYLCEIDPSETDLEGRFLRDRRFADYARSLTGSPLLMCTDMEHGPGTYLHGKMTELPNYMAWAACDNEQYIERAAELTARITRKKFGIHYTLSPVTDLFVNFRTPTMATRSMSDDPDRVIRIAGAYVRGIQKNGYLAATIKHFPGEGVDERNSHFLTTVNSFSRTKWMKTYGKVYKALFKVGVDSVMVGHSCCPAFQSSEEIDEYGALPGTLSKDLMAGLLKEKLGFKGCVISDAMSMIGACARVPEEKLSVEFIKAGGDLVLFPEPEQYDYLVKAVKSGEIPMERIKDAVYRVMRLKEKTRLYEEEKVQNEIGDIDADITELNELAQKIADNAVKVVRNNEKVLPIKCKKGKVIIIKVGGSFFNTEPDNTPFEYIEKEFKERGWEVNSQFFPKHKYLKSIMNEYDLVVVACHGNYHGSTLRVGWSNMMAFWRGYILQHPNIVFVGLDDPCKLYDFPYAKTYINAFGTAPVLQRSVVKLILGEIESRGKNPLSFPPYFERED